jgi:hypothetical protein
VQSRRTTPSARLTLGWLLLVFGALVFLCGLCSMSTPALLGPTFGGATGDGGGWFSDSSDSGNWSSGSSDWNSGDWGWSGSDSGSWDSGGFDSGSWDSGGSDSGSW